MSIKCIFCDFDVSSWGEQQFRPTSTLYDCPICGVIQLTEEARDDFAGEKFTDDQKAILSIILRNDYEKRNRIHRQSPLTLANLHDALKQYKPKDPLDKMDTVLLTINSISKYVGHQISINIGHDYPYYHCMNSRELHSIIILLSQEGLIIFPSKSSAKIILISTKGYQRLRELNRSRKDSRLCFVAMWFAPEMNTVYEKAIKPAIEYIEERDKQSRFDAVKIDNVHHINDINDEIIAQIRRSRFMVCDLTGYRGGVYFEAGFSYGLGIDVIYTCRKDWTKEEYLHDESGKEIKYLFDKKGSKIGIKKEGVHFDLAHRNRIEWEMKALDKFKIELTNRIKAVII